MNDLLSYLNLTDSELNKSINQNKDFRKYQKKHNSYLNFKANTGGLVESFETSYAENSHKILNKNNLTNAELKEIESLKKEYNLLLLEFQILNNNIMSTSSLNYSISTSKKQQLDQLSSRLNLLALQITDKTNLVLNKNSNINEQIAINKGVFSNSVSDLKKLSSVKKTKDINNINGIVNDSNILILQENYKFLLWSILAVGIVSFSLNVMKN